MLRVNLLLDNPGGARSGHLNVDPFAPDDDPHGRSRGDVADLRAFVEANEADEIVALDVLDRLPLADAKQAIRQWVGRLRLHGLLTVSVLDMDEVARKIHRGGLGFEEANLLLYDRQDHPARVRRCLLSSEWVVAAMQDAGLRIARARLDGVRAVVTGERV